MEKINDLRQRLDVGGNPDQLIKEAGKELGDCLSFHPTIPSSSVIPF